MEPIMFYPHDDAKSYKCVAYFANQENFYYSPEHDLNNLALEIARSSGPSGSNKEYLFNACGALRLLAAECGQVDNELFLAHDSHMFKLEMLVKSFEETIWFKTTWV